MLPLYFNYLSTLTLRVLQTHETQCGLPRLTPEDMQYTSTVPRRAAALETARQDALGSGLCGVTGSFGVRGTGEPPPPPPSPTPDQNRHAMLPISLSGCPREEDHTDEKIKAGRLKSHFSQKRKKKRLNSGLLYLLSLEINKVLGLQNCWFGDLDDARKGWGGVGRAPGLSRRSPGPRARAVPRQLRPSCGGSRPAGRGAVLWSAA